MGKLRKSARGRECLVRIPGYCSCHPDTTVLAHWPGGGMGMKQPDILGAFAGDICHSILDGRIKTEFSYDQLRLWHAEAIFRTQQIWLEDGLIEIK